jgi:hypothetical protein
MTRQPPHPPEPPNDGDDDGWIPDDDWQPQHAGTRPHLAAAHHPDPDTTTGPGEEIPWGNTAEELLAESMQRLGELTDEVTALHRIVVADRDEAADRGPGRYHRYRYERHQPKVAAAAHTELTAWVSWAVATYHLDDVLPACWERHDGLAEELAAFYVAWCNVWSDEGPYDAGPVWHDQLYRAIDRWPTWLAGTRCTQNCTADPALDATSHQHWQQRSHDAEGATWRLERTRKFSPPRPVPRKKRAAAAGPS